jgi:hypothetical protein
MVMIRMLMTMENLLRIKKLNFCFILLLCANTASAATEISPYFGVGSDTFQFTVEDLAPDSNILEYEPNIPGLSRIGINAYGFGLSYSARSDLSSVDIKKGKSDFFDLQLGYHNDQWGAEIFAQNYTGFYLKNSADFGGGNTYAQFPDLKWSHYGLLGRWAMDNQGFSITDLTTQVKQIKKTAGSYFLVGGFRYHSLDTDISIIPTTIAILNSEMDTLRRLKASSINLGLGAGKYWVSNSHFFIGGVFDLISTYALYNYESTSGQTTNSYGTLSYNLKAGFGYSGETYRSGVYFKSDVTTLKAFQQAIIKPSAVQILVYLRVVL